jgi:uncharacterized membrane protein
MKQELRMGIILGSALGILSLLFLAIPTGYEGGFISAIQTFIFSKFLLLTSLIHCGAFCIGFWKPIFLIAMICLGFVIGVIIRKLRILKNRSSS